MIEFFKHTSKGLAFERVREELLDLPYQHKTSHDLSLLFQMTRAWIGQRRRPCLN